MTKKTDTPAIRFKGFSDTWEQRKLNEVGVVIDPHPSHRAPKEEQGGIPFIGIGDVDEMGNINRESARPVPENVYDEHHKRYDLNVPSLGLGRVASLGKVIRLRSDIGKYAISPTISVLQFSENINIDYLYAYMNTPQFKKQFEGKSNGSTRQSVGTEMVRLLNLSMPFNLDEQKAIGTFYKNLDNLITLHQREYEKLHNIKKSMLEKMFPKNGSNVPEIRFKGFTEAWEQRKLGEIGSVSMCRRIFKEQTSETGDIPFYKIGTFGADPDAFISRELFEEYKSKYPYPQKGDILISASGSIGRTVEFAGNNEYFQDSNIVWLNHDERLSNPFLKCFYSVVKWAGIEGSTIKRLYNDNILNTVICMPSVPEQKRIGLFFENLDNLITLHQRELEKLQNIKKSMLEKMFV